jgi:putative glutamine amidotransferase
MKKPWIGIPTRYHDKTETVGQIRHYVEAVLWAGGLPLLIPSIGDREVIGEYVERVQGILLPGSPTDIEPKHYGATPHEKLGRLLPDRDATDFAILDLVEQKALPLLGICFGVQSLNVHRGGSLVQDIPSVVKDPVLHDEHNDKPAARHLVRVSEDSLIGRLAGRSELDVNSYHHQSIEKAGRNLRAVAFAPDGVIEAVEDTGGRFIIGVQWHPERGWREDPFSQALFMSFIEQARLRYNS